MKIARVDTLPIEIDYPGDGYAMSHVHLTRHVGRLVRLVTDTGAEGYGEIVRKSITGPGVAVGIEDALLPELDGLALADVPALLNRWRDSVDPGDKDRVPVTLAAGVELAMLDLMARQSGMPLSSLLGGPATGQVGAYASLSTGAPEVMADQVPACPDHPVIQAKLGVGEIETDMQRVEAVLAAMGPDQKLLADFNGALDLDTALRALPAIQDPRLTWEDPCLAYEDNAAVARALDAPVMFDMCMSGVDVFLRAIRDGVAGSVVIKPPFVGGLSAARTARDLCAAARMPFRIDGPWSGPLAAAGNVHLALGAPRDLLICSADLTAPFDLAENLVTHPAPGQVSVAPGPGLGDAAPGFFGAAS